MSAPTDVMAYLGGSNSSLYSHLTQADARVYRTYFVLSFNSFYIRCSQQSWCRILTPQKQISTSSAAQPLKILSDGKNFPLL